MTNETINNIIIEQPIKIKDSLEIKDIPSISLTPKANRDPIEDIPSSSLTKRKRGPPKGKYITAPWRYKEDGTYYNNKPLNKNYFNDYYRDHYRGKVNCPLCNREVVKVVLHRHQNTNICKNRQVSNIV